MATNYNPTVHRFAVFVVGWTVLLFVAGALVTSNDAALSVPDWPKSFGTWFPSLRMLAGGAFFEHSHRVIAQIVFGALLAIAVFTSRWWIADHPRLSDSGGPSIHAVAVANAEVIFLQVVLGAGFRHQEIPVWPHIAGAFVVMGMVIWTAIVLRKRFGTSPELSRARVMLHAIFGIQFLLGFGAYWSRIATVGAAQPMPIMVWLTVIHTVVGALLFAFSVFIVLICFRIVPRGREVAAPAPGRVTV
jgi:heme A synthase